MTARSSESLSSFESEYLRSIPSDPAALFKFSKFEGGGFG